MKSFSRTKARIRLAVLLIRALFARPVRHRAAIGGMALFWAGDALAVWSA